MKLETSLFDYPLSSDAIAQHPVQKRDHSKLMVVRREDKSVEHRHFYELPEILAQLPQKPVLFRNTARVIRARFLFQKQRGSAIEILLLRPSTSDKLWWCLCRGLRKLAPKESLFYEGKEVATLQEKSTTGEALFEFLESPLVLSEKIGSLPLPPYIARAIGDGNDTEDSVRYQTVYAKQPVAAAAPTAGLHFTPELISTLEKQGCHFEDLVLHVGLDTFRPISTEYIEEHKIHTETYEVPTSASETLRQPRVFRLAVGTTSLRTMEDYTRKGFPHALTQAASIFIYPPQKIVSADALITNFHLPKSTLLCLVSAFLTPGSLDGIRLLKDLYAEALRKDYRFYSYGDAMLIL